MPPSDPSRQCVECGTPLSAEATFCPSCGTRASRSSEHNRCQSCGAELGSEDQYCAECGTPRHQDPTSASDQQGQSTAHGGGDDHHDHRRPSQSSNESQSSGPDPLYSRPAFRERVGTYTDAGWSIVADRDDEVDVEYRDAGGVLFHAALMLLFVTAIWGNLLYAGYRWFFRSKKGTISAYEPPEGWPDIDPRSDGGALHYVGAFIAALFLFLFVAATLEDPTNPIGWMWTLAGLLSVVHLLPPVRRRLHDRGSLTEFGRTRTTDETVDYGAETCVVCSSVVNTTLRREYEERIVVAGVPLYTVDEGENHYCETCAKPGSILEDRLDAGDVPDGVDESPDEADSIDGERGSEHEDATESDSNRTDGAPEPAEPERDPNA